MAGKIIVIMILWILNPDFTAIASADSDPNPISVNGTGNSGDSNNPVDEIDTIKSFEGTLHYILDINGIKQDFRYRIRGRLVRIEIDDPHMGGSMTILAAPDDDRMLVLIHKQHAFTELTLDDITDRSNFLIQHVNRLTPTGEKLKIGGIENHEYLITAENGEILRVWSPGKSTRFGLFRFPDFIDRVLSEMLKNDLPMGMFPFAITYQGKRSTVDFTLVSIQEELLDMDLFTVPANYRKLPVILPEY